MAKYTQLIDVRDPALVATEGNLLSADVLVDAKLRSLAINPADLVLPQPLLTELAKCYALRQAAIEGAIGENSPLIDKAKQYEKSAALLVESITREGLGLTTPTGSGYGSITLGRG